VIIDAHVHMRGKVFQGDNRGDKPGLIDVMERHGIEKSIVMGLTAEDNLEILAEIARFPKQLIPFILLLPGQNNLDSMLEKSNEIVAVRGIGEIYAQPGPAQSHLDYMRPVLEIARHNNLPVLFHTGDFSYTAPMMLMEIFQAYPDVNFIIGHMGSHHFWLDTIELLKMFPNTYTDTSGMQSPLILRRAIQECGPEKILYGSDFPYWDPGVEIPRIFAAKLDPNTERLILGENATRLFSL